MVHYALKSDEASDYRGNGVEKIENSDGNEADSKLPFRERVPEGEKELETERQLDELVSAHKEALLLRSIHPLIPRSRNPIMGRVPGSALAVTRTLAESRRGRGRKKSSGRGGKNTSPSGLTGSGWNGGKDGGRAGGRGGSRGNDENGSQFLAAPQASPGFNLASEWQARGNYYVGYESLRTLADQLQTYEQGEQAGRSRVQKRALLRELVLTYFARAHNSLREEYQHERRAVEERIRSWGAGRLRREGYALFDLRAVPKGTLFQDKVFRLTLDPLASAAGNARGRDIGPMSSLGFHRFGVGDSVRLSRSRSRAGPLSGSALDGVVLDRRAHYLEVCFRATDSVAIDPMQRYRLDCFVSRVGYDRMMQALHLLLQADGSPGAPLSQPAIARPLRDLLLYSYPGSLLRMARSPGGLRLSLPPLQAAAAQPLHAAAAQPQQAAAAQPQQVAGSGAVVAEADGGGEGGLGGYICSAYPADNRHVNPSEGSAAMETSSPWAAVAVLQQADTGLQSVAADALAAAVDQSRPPHLRERLRLAQSLGDKVPWESLVNRTEGSAAGAGAVGTPPRALGSRQAESKIGDDADFSSKASRAISGDRMTSPPSGIPAVDASTIKDYAHPGTDEKGAAASTGAGTSTDWSQRNSSVLEPLEASQQNSHLQQPVSSSESAMAMETESRGVIVTTVAEQLQQLRAKTPSSSSSPSFSRSRPSVTAETGSAGFIASSSSLQQQVKLNYRQRPEQSAPAAPATPAAAAPRAPATLSEPAYATSPTNHLLPVFETNHRLRTMARLPPLVHSSDSSTGGGAVGESNAPSHPHRRVAKEEEAQEAQELDRAMDALEEHLRRQGRSGLNPSQQDALREAVRRPLTLIQGPPGTGKVGGWA